MEGTIKKVIAEKGFGFITVDGEDKDLFFHKNEVKDITFEELKEGDRVSFEKADSPKGPNATGVTRL